MTFDLTAANKVFHCFHRYLLLCGCVQLALLLAYSAEERVEQMKWIPALFIQ